MIDRLEETKVIGIKQCKKVILNGQTKLIYVAEDADKRLIKQLLEIAKENGVQISKIESMHKLGKMCGIDVKAAAAAIINN